MSIIINPDIGKGWDHFQKKRIPIASPITEYNYIIQTLSPIIHEMTNHFGLPTTQNEMTHINNQVIAKAMEIPQVMESITTMEMAQWGRVPLLQTVVELMIIQEQIYSKFFDAQKVQSELEME